MEEEKEGGYWKLLRDFPHLPDRASFRLVMEWGAAPKPAKSSQPCYRKHVALNIALSPPPKLTPLYSLPTLHAHNQLRASPDSAVCRVLREAIPSPILGFEASLSGERELIAPSTLDFKKFVNHKAAPQPSRTYLRGGGGGWTAEGVHRRQILRLGGG